MSLDIALNDTQVVGYLLLNKLDVRKANSLSGHFAYGFPSITAFKGFTHALTRALHQSDKPELNGLSLRGVMVACHDHEIYGIKDTYNNIRFSQFSFPASTMSQVGALVRDKRLPSITEQAYVDMVVSLVIEVVSEDSITPAIQEGLERFIFDFTRKGRVAGGVVQYNLSEEQVAYLEYEDLDDIAYMISDSYILTDAQELMRQYLEENPSKNALDAILDLSSQKIKPTLDEDGIIKMQRQPIDDKYKGLAVMSVGYQGIAPAISSRYFKGSISQHQDGVKTQYVEAVYSFVKWELPHVLRLNNFLRHSFWMYESENEETPSVYLISQPKLSQMYSNNNGV